MPHHSPSLSPPTAPRSARLPRVALLAALLCAVVALPAAAQYVTFPRLGVSAAPDHYDPHIEVQGDEPFQLYILAMPPEGEATLGHQFQSFQWTLLEPCCGGAAAIIAEEYHPGCSLEGNPLAGVTMTAEDCLEGDVILLCTLTLEMSATELQGTYFVYAGPMDLAYDCAGEGVVMTDMLVQVEYTPTVSAETTTTFSEVKGLFRD